MTATRFAAAIVAAQVLAQIGAFTLPALLPGFIARWSLSATEAGWLIGAFFAAYVVAVPVLVALTDRVPARRIYMIGTGLTAVSHLGFALVVDGFWGALLLRILAGVGWAGCYMPGLKVLADRLEGAEQSRAVGMHAAGVGVAGAMSFAVAGALDALAGPEGAFLFGAVAAATALVIGALAMPREAPHRQPGRSPTALLDFRPVLRNRAAMAWIAGYTVHTWELAVLRAWGVTFLAATIAWHGAPSWLPGPSAIFTVAGLLGIAVSLTGNEVAQRFGRLRVVSLAMGAGAVFALLAGASALFSAPMAALCVIAWNAAIYLDSSALTAGTVQAAEKERRGATMGLHSMCGYAGGFLGPVIVGLVLDVVGAEGALGWALAFGHIAPVTLVGLWLLRRFSAAARSG
ncbi:MAG: MFS transporter [Pseudomonadota bacterium]